MNKLQKNLSLNDTVNDQLQHQITMLEKELEQLKSKTEQFEMLVRRNLYFEIDQIAKLSELYKQHKKEKKNKRREQKKRGKNYKEPNQLLRPNTRFKPVPKSEPESQIELKRIYKEAVVQVHPDKISQFNEVDQIQNASELTARLNSIYKSGDLDELVYFYHHVILTNSSDDYLQFSKVDDKLKIDSLQKKKERLQAELEKIKQSYSFHIIDNYRNPTDFIDELRLQFIDKIKQLEKRTRKIK